MARALRLLAYISLSLFVLAMVFPFQVNQIGYSICVQIFAGLTEVLNFVILAAIDARGILA